MLGPLEGMSDLVMDGNKGIDKIAYLLQRGADRECRHRHWLDETFPDAKLIPARTPDEKAQVKFPLDRETYTQATTPFVRRVLSTH